MRHLLCRASPVVLAVLWASQTEARPGSPERHPLGAESAGLGGAGIAGRDSAWFNPAGLGWTVEQGLSASVSAYGYTYESAPRFVEVDAGDGAIIGRIENNSIDLFPASLQYAKPLGRLGPLSLGVGLSVMVPDFDQFDGVLEVPPERFTFEVRGRRIAESRTFWAVLALGACAGPVCFGVGPAAALHLEKEVTITSLFIGLDDGSVIEASETSQAEILVAALGAEAGLQLHLGRSVHLGLSVRTPVKSLFSRGSLITTLSQVDPTQGTAFVDRVDVQDPRLDYRQPWRFGLGVMYEIPKVLSLAADVRFTTALSEYALVLGPNGEAALPPEVPGGTIDDPDRALTVKRAAALRPAINFNAGARVFVTDTVALHVGTFSDLSATSDDDALRNSNDKMNRIGATLGGGWASDDLTTWVTAVYAYGWGSAVGLGDGFEPVLADLRAHSIHLLIGSTANF